MTVLLRNRTELEFSPKTSFKNKTVRENAFTYWPREFNGADREGILRCWRGYVNFTKFSFSGLSLNRSLIPEASAHFNQVQKSSPQYKKSRIFAVGAVKFSLDNAELKGQYPVTAHAPNVDFWTGCREIKRCEESKRTASRLADFIATLKLLRITDQ